MAEGSWVGLDVHARTTLAGVLDAASGELSLQRVQPRSEETIAWLLSLAQPVRLAYEESYGAVAQAKGRRDALDQAIVELAGEPPFCEVVGRLCCLRGVSTLTALALSVELGEWERFRAESLGPFLGLVPSEDSSGERRRQGAITKTGNTHARRLLVEAARHQRRPLRASAALERRRQGQPAPVRARADESARRLHQRWHALEGRGKRRTIVAVAVARELARRGERTGDRRE